MQRTAAVASSSARAKNLDRGTGRVNLVNDNWRGYDELWCYTYKS